MKSKFFDFTEKNGLVFCDKMASAKNNAEKLYLLEAKRLDATAVFFRRYYRENEKKPYHSEPAVCIFEKKEVFFNSNDHHKLHAKLWSAGRNEIYILETPTRTDIINARKPADVKSDKQLSIEGEVLETYQALTEYRDKKFSAYLFGSGTFWEQTELQTKLDEHFSPYIHLLNHLMEARKEFQSAKNEFNLPHSVIDKLLVVSILIKFLEEIKDDKGKHTLRSIYKKLGINGFDEAAEKHLVTNVLDELSNEFNGKIFDKFTDAEKVKIQKANLSLLSSFLQAKTNIRTRQLFLWEQYNFKYLPAEVISAIYENFIQADAQREDGETEKGIVYTPIHLVNLLIDEVMPLDKPELFKDGKFKVLDPTCGSGVFLVAAFKRLLQWWAINNSTESEIRYPQSKDAQRILEENIYGVDVKETATLVTIFGLTTALLDKLTPQQIWNNFRFKDLSLNNIRTENFFEWALNAKKGNLSFDLVVGNPPFNPEKGKTRAEILEPKILQQLDFKHKKIPNNNFALHFLECAMILSNRLCLIIPSNVLLYNKAAQDYRLKLFTDFTVNKIYDFTHLRRDLFHKSADTPVVAIILQNKPSQNKSIEHIVVKRMIASEKKVRFEIDYYDKHFVPLTWAIDEKKQFVWKTNLLGGGRLYHLIYRLSLLTTLKEYLKKLKEENPEWEYCSGYKIGAGVTDKSAADYIHLKPTIDTKVKFDEKSHEFSTKIETAHEFEAPRNKKLFSPPVLIIAEVLGSKRIPMQIFSQYQPFNISFIGIHAPSSEKEILQEIYNRIYKDEIKSQLFKTYMLATSSKLLVHKETAFIKEDLDGLPFPKEEKYLKLSDSEKILQTDVLNYYIHLGKSISTQGEARVLHLDIDNNQLTRFGRVFCDELNSIYAKNNKSWQIGGVSKRDSFIVYQLGFGKNNGLKYDTISKYDKEIETLISDNMSNSGAIFRKVIRIYKHINGYDCLFLIKPKAQRYWLDSIALRDADDTFSDLKKEGY